MSMATRPSARPRAPHGADEERRRTSLVLVAFVPAGIVAVCCVAAVLVALLTAGGGLAGTFGAVGGVWMAVHHVPVYVGALKLGALPLLPTAVLFFGVARYAARVAGAEDPPSRHVAIIASAAAGPALVTLVMGTVIGDASSSTPVATVGMAASVLIVAAVHAAAALCGVGSRALPRYVEAWGLPSVVPSVLRGGAAAVAALLTWGAATVVIGLLLGFGRAAEVFAAEPSAVGKIGLLVLSVLYVPNAAVGAAGVLVGTGAHLGAAEYSLFATHPGPLPDIPLAGVLPNAPTSPAWACALVGTAGVALWCSARHGVVGGTRAGRLRYAVSVAAVAAAGALVSGYLAGGALGVFDSIGLDVPVFALSVLGWFAVAGAIVALLQERAGRGFCARVSRIAAGVGVPAAVLRAVGLGGRDGGSGPAQPGGSGPVQPRESAAGRAGEPADAGSGESATESAGEADADLDDDG